MLRLRLSILLLFCFSCSGETPLPEPADTRAPIDVAYVTAAELKLHQRPDANAPVVATYQHSEAVSILARQGEWVEIRTGDRSGWGRAAELGTAQEATQQADNPTPRFRTPPPTVTNLTAKGELYIEADVNTSGEVIATRIITNTTGSDALAAQNASALMRSRFYPMVINGEHKPFKYYHRVTY